MSNNFIGKIASGILYKVTKGVDDDMSKRPRGFQCTEEFRKTLLVLDH